MDELKIKQILKDLPLNQIEIHSQIGSTNDRASELADLGTPDLSLVLADEQTKGRGRAGRAWFTPPGSALAFTLLLRPKQKETVPSQYTGLGAVAVCEALEAINLSPEIKWPNDVLLGGKKVCGVLTEAQWVGDELQAILLGIGINIAPQSVPPANQVAFPATSVEQVLEKQIDRWLFLYDILQQLIKVRERVGGAGFTKSWESRLAFINQTVQVIAGETATAQGRIIGLDSSGALRLRLEEGTEKQIDAGEIRLRPLVDSKTN